MMHYVSIKAAWTKLDQPAIHLWIPSTHPIKKRNDWYSLALPYMTVHTVENVNYPSCPTPNVDRLYALQALYKEGGIYMDVSMLTLRSFVHVFERDKAIIGKEDDNAQDGSGSLIVAPPRDEFVRRVLEHYEDACSRASHENVNVDGVSSAMYASSHVKQLVQRAFYHPRADDAWRVTEPKGQDELIKTPFWGVDQYAFRVWDDMLSSFDQITPNGVEMVFKQHTPLWMIVRPYVQHLYPASVQELYHPPQLPLTPLDECTRPGMILVDDECFRDEWIVPGLLSPSNCTLSDTPDWTRVHWLMWTTDLASLRERYHRMLETIFSHDPRAIVFMLTTKLALGTFDYFNRAGYRFYQIPFTMDKLIQWKWYTTESSKQFLQNAWMYQTTKFFYSHMTDYLRFILLYRYGGTYADTDAIWLQRPSYNPDLAQEGYAGIHAGKGYSEVACGLIVAKKGWTFLRKLHEKAFANYISTCWGCFGPTALTNAIWGANKDTITMGKYRVLQHEYLYPADGVDIRRYFYQYEFIDELMDGLKPRSMNLHLFNSLTHNQPIEPGSVLDTIFNRMALFLHGRDKDEVQLSAPSSFKVYKENQPMPFERFHLVMLQHAQEGRHPATISISCKFGYVSLPSQIDSADSIVAAADSLVDHVVREQTYPRARTITVELKQASAADVNWVLNRLHYTSRGEVYGSSDTIDVEVEFGNKFAAVNIYVDAEW